VSARRTLPPWGAVLAVCVGLLVAFDAVLSYVATGYFRGGFNTPYVVEGALDISAYFAAAVVLDTAFVLGIWTAAGAALRRCRGPLQMTCAAMLLALVPAFLVGSVHHNLQVTLGEMIAASLLAGGSAGSSMSAAAMITEETTPFTVAVLCAGALACFAVVAIAGRLDRRRSAEASPAAALRLRTSAGGFLACIVPASAILFAAAALNPLMRYGLSQKASGIVLERLVQWTTDVDRDGYGFLSAPPDSEPFDSSVHPYALEAPGNGQDENGVGGDRPTDFRVRESESESESEGAAAIPDGPRPSLLIVFLETFRADLLDEEIDGRPVAPFLSRLARESTSSNRMYVHSPWTLPSRSQLFAGKFFPRRGERTIVDDFQAHGYTVALFSGQDDSYGDSVELMGADRADRFYDARQDLARRTSRTAASISLQVSWKTVLERVEEYLDGRRDEKPLLLYVNIVDTHYPYTHDEIDDLLGVGPLPRDAIRADNAKNVWRGYANSAANVDRAVERLVGSWRRRFPAETSAILVTADHGESFYEEGTLGHGQLLSRAETQVPLILSGIGGKWPEPIAISDLRNLIAANLFLPRGVAAPRAELVGDPERRVFQYLGQIEKPKLIGFRTLDGLLAYDFRTSEAWQSGPADDARRPAPIESAPAEQLIWTWEALQERALRDGAAP
jgi:hypothetical protein